MCMSEKVNESESESDLHGQTQTPPTLCHPNRLKCFERHTELLTCLIKETQNYTFKNLQSFSRVKMKMTSQCLLDFFFSISSKCFDRHVLYPPDFVIELTQL